jgi:hypothetical protein
VCLLSVGCADAPYLVVIDDGGAHPRMAYCSDAFVARGYVYCIHANQRTQEKFDTASVVRIDSLTPEKPTTKERSQ